MNKLFLTRNGNRKLIFSIFAVIIFGFIILKFSIGLYICPFHLATGLNCPGCGGTRALLALSKFDIQTAFYFNPLITSLTFIFLIWFIWFVKNAFIGKYKQPFNSRWYVVFGVALAIITIIFWIVRNTELYQRVLY